MDFIVKGHKEETAHRWQVAIDDKNLDSIRDLRVIETRPEHFMNVLADGKPSTNTYLRRIHNFALDVEWLLKSVVPKRLWPKSVPKEKRGITEDQHRRIIEAENLAARRNQGSRNSDEPHYHERRDFYELLWHIGASQSDAAFLCAENINWSACTISYTRCKLARHDRARVKPAVFRFGQEVADILRRRPQTGPLFPYLRRVRPGDRATEFKQRCHGLNIHGVTLHSYRYGWAERALACGYPQRFAQQALGHNSKAVHHAYSKNADVIVPSLADWQAHWQKAQQLMELPKPTATPLIPPNPNGNSSTAQNGPQPTA